MKRHTTLVLIALTLIITTASTWATTYYVNPGESIQDGIDSATDGDTVIVLPGIYYENIFFNGKNVVLTSTDPDSSAIIASTIIYGGAFGSVVKFDGSETITCILTGFTIRNGAGTFDFGYYFGGGIYGTGCYATIQNNTITGNSAEYGGGLSDCFGTIQNNTISGNTAESGGGLYRCVGTIQNNTITGNLAISGGGLCICDGTVQSNTITDNTASFNGGGLFYCDGIIQDNIISENSADLGGGLYKCDETIQDNIIAGNSADVGGGLYQCTGTIQSNTITGNLGRSFGGGLIWCDGTIQGNIISGNLVNLYDGGGLYQCDGTIQNNTITGNSAGGKGGGLDECSATVVNCIVWGNTALIGPQLWSGSTPTNSCIQDWGGGGEGNISNDPMFAGYAYDTGIWTADAVAVYDGVTFQTRLTDAGAAWPENALVGMFLRPYTATAFQYNIVSNTDTSIIVSCDLADSVQAGDNYEIYDYHLQAGSPCIDAGDSSAVPADVADLDDDGDTTEQLPFDLDGNTRLVESTWDDVLQISSDNDTYIALTWPPPDYGDVDMGAYEYQVQFTVQTRNALDTGIWQDVFTGNGGTWTDTSTLGANKRFYRVLGE